MSQINGASTTDDSVFGLLQHLDKDELQSFLDDESKIIEMVLHSCQVKNWNSEREAILVGNRSIAEFNISLESRFLELKENLIGEHEKTREAKEKCMGLRAKIDSMADKYSVDTIIALVLAAAAESEEKSDELSQSFLSGNIDPDKFFDEYISIRTLATERRIKAEKLNELPPHRSSGEGDLVRNYYNNRLPPYPMPDETGQNNNFGFPTY